MEDALDAIMRIMERAFDPAYGEAWNRRQVGDSLSLRNTHFLLADRTGREPAKPEEAVGFIMSRGVVDEEELLLIAVLPEARGHGVATALLQRFTKKARARGMCRIFLEMRDGNPAEKLYLQQGFSTIGRRRNYYKSGSDGPFDAITFARMIA